MRGLVLLAGVLATTPVQAQDATATQKAYKLSIKCFVAAGSRDQESAKVAYDAAMRLAHLQGLTDKQINYDFADMMAVENLQISRNAAYRDQVMVACRKIGLAV